MKKLLLALAFTALAFPVFAQDQQYVEGVHYELLNEVQPVQTGEKIEVVEMFWYSCPHCFKLEPYVLKWLESKPENAEYVPVPAIFNENWILQARVYYTFEALGMVDELHTKYFDANHLHDRPFRTPEQVFEWAANNGVDRSTFESAFNSFAVNNKLNFSNQMSSKYGINGVPAIIVDGKYRTSVSTAGSQAELFNVVNFLVAKAAEERKG